MMMQRFKRISADRGGVVRGVLVTIPAAIVLGSLVAGTMLPAAGGGADEPSTAKKADDGNGDEQQREPPDTKWVRPENWPAGHPLPEVASNCAQCHLTAGRELTAAVFHFTRSVHDLDGMSCSDCHGGNTEDDVKAHEEDFGFIGTKKSTHIETCSECHADEADVLAAGPHHWDFSKRINTEYPLCFDCHGNHDIGNSPEDFKLEAMCGDCHEDMKADFPHLASVVKQYDRLWEVMGKVRHKRITNKTPIPPQFQDGVASLRSETMRVIHTSEEIPAEKAKTLNERFETLRAGMQKWLQSGPEDPAPTTNTP